jgi:aspartyl-tRNA(Asn)/glutamyl-tRNA(Gln) amidotransferase subunit A
MPLSFSLDHAGPLTWTVEDAAIVLQVIAGHDARDPASADRAVPDYQAALVSSDLKGVRLGIARVMFERDCPSAGAMGKAFDRGRSMPGRYRQLASSTGSSRRRQRLCYLGPGRRGTCSSRSAGASGHSIS